MAIDDEDKLNSLLHWMKGFEKFSHTFAGLVHGSKTWCPFAHNGCELDPECYDANPSVQALLNWVRNYVQCVKFLDVNRYTVDEMSHEIEQLAFPERVGDYEQFQRFVSNLRASIDFIEPEVSKKLDLISCEECKRLDEALVCFCSYCFTASVVMAVSSVEVRIVGLIRKHNMRLFQTEFSRYTLGQLIQVFDDNKYKDAKYVRVKALMPAKHKPLLSLLNQYRIFSVHPKGEVVTAQVAESILHLSCTFLFDATTSPYTDSELKCKSRAVGASTGSPGTNPRRALRGVTSSPSG